MPSIASMSIQAATARGSLSTVESSREITKTWDSAQAHRWRSWSGAVAACCQKALSTSFVPALAVGDCRLMAWSARSQARRCELLGLASWSSIQAL